MRETTKEIGLWTAVALVMGNMIGSGVFLLPASLAAFGGLSLAGWAISTGGSVCLALVFAHLARRSPDAGGPYAYTRRSFGDLAGFLVAWGYWISTWSTNAALAVAFVGYLDPFVPGLVRNPITAALLAVATIWLLTAVNLRGVRAAGQMQVATTIVKIVPLAIIGVAGLAHFVPANFTVQPAGAGVMSQRVLETVTLTLWAFLGLESATIPAGSVRDASRTIARATIIGTLLAAAIYIVSTVGVMAVIAPAVLSKTTAPFADAATGVFGSIAGAVVALGAAVSCFGALNGWTLVVGQLPLAVAEDGLFPQVFRRVTSRGVPAHGMIISSLLATALVGMNYSQGLVKLFTFIILLATLSTLVPYVFCALAVFMRGHATKPPTPVRTTTLIVAGLAFVYSIGAILGAGADTVYWGFLLLLAGLPVYTWVAQRPAARPSA